MKNWIIWRAGLLILLVAGLCYEVEGALRLGLFLIWASFFISWFCCNDKMLKAASLPLKFSKISDQAILAYDLTVLGLLGWFGHFFAATAWTVQIIILWGARKRAKNFKQDLEPFNQTYKNLQT